MKKRNILAISLVLASMFVLMFSMFGGPVASWVEPLGPPGCVILPEQGQSGNCNTATGQVCWVEEPGAEPDCQDCCNWCEELKVICPNDKAQCGCCFV